MRFNNRVTIKRTIISLIVCLLVPSKIIFAQEDTDLKLDIYSKLRDYRCNTMSLDKCDCPAAKEMKAYIEGLIETDTSKDDIFYKVAKKFSINTVLDEKIKADIEKRLSRELGEGRPQLALELNSIDLGKVSRKKVTIKKDIKVHNKGKTDLIITNIRASCSCTTAVLTVDKIKSPAFTSKGAQGGWQMVLGPDKTGHLEITLDLTKFPVNHPKISRDVYITSNDPINTNMKVSLKGELIP